jgi:hypothetical protein
VACTYRRRQSKEKRNPYQRKKDTQPALGARNRLASLDALKSWIDTHKPLNFMSRGFQRLILLLELESPGERFTDGWLTAPFPKPDVDEDDPASSIPMSAMCSSGDTRETEMDYNCTENWLLVATRVRLKPCTISRRPQRRCKKVEQVREQKKQRRDVKLIHDEPKQGER